MAAAAAVNKIVLTCCPKFGRTLKYLKYTQNFTLCTTGVVQRNLCNHVINHATKNYSCQITPKNNVFLPVLFKKWSSSVGDELIGASALQEIRRQLQNVLSEDDSLSSNKIVTYLNTVENVIQKKPDDDIEVDTNEVSAVELYYLGSKVYSLQGRGGIGEEVLSLAIPLFKCSASLGYHDAKYTYAQLLLRPSGGVMPDPVEAAKIFSELAQDGHPYAQFALAGMYSSGYGIEQNFEKSLTLYEIAAENGIAQGYNSIGKLYFHGQGVKKDETKAVEYFKRGVEAGDVHAYLSLGNCYSHGKGVETDFSKSFEYHSKAAELGNPYALHNVGTHYFLGKGVELDVQKAAEYFEKASNLGHTLSSINLGKMYYEGFGVGLNWTKAKEYLNRAGEHKEAQMILEAIDKQEKTQGIPKAK